MICKNLTITESALFTVDISLAQLQIYMQIPPTKEPSIHQAAAAS